MPIYVDEPFYAMPALPNHSKEEDRGRNKALRVARSYQPPKDAYTAELHARVLSNLAHLELIAIEAAKRGDGIDNQLEDEFFHHYTFVMCAEKAFRLFPADKPTQDLIDYLKGLEGQDSIAILNIVAEHWLETVFHHLAKVESFIPDVFRIIEEDEHRHSHDARKTVIEWTQEREDIVRDIEKLLFEVANSPFFMLPLVRLMGRIECSYMGQDLAKAHENSCIHLGIKPKVAKIKALARNGRNLAKNTPLPVEMRPWDRIKARMWKTANEAAQVAFQKIYVPEGVKNNHVVLQIRLARALGITYKQYPELRRVFRNGQIYEPQTTILGLRVLHNDRDQVGTVFFNPDKYDSRRAISKMLQSRIDRMNRGEYEDLPDYSELEKYFYPSYAVATITSNAKHGGLYGHGPLIDVEGIGTAFTIGEIQEEFVSSSIDYRIGATKHFFILTIKMDHRPFDGKEIGLMAKAVKTLFEDSSLFIERKRNDSTYDFT